MANRHLARSIVMQTLFEWDLTGKSNSRADAMLTKNVTEFAPDMKDDTFLVELVQGVLKKHAIIDQIIEKAAPDWPIEKIASVDRNILRLGLYELLFGDREQVPPKVAINEAIELAKSFGGENSGRFVNGVLGAVYREIGEPGKDQTGKKKINLGELPVDQKAGAVVYAITDGGNIKLAMVHDIFGYWTLSKCGINEAEKETPKQAAARAIKEEITLDVEVEALLGENEYIAKHPTRGKVRKHVSYFLAKSDHKPLSLEQDSGGLDDARWFDLEEVPDLRMYDDITQMITKALQIISSKQ